MQFIDVLNQNSGAINVMLTMLYVLATLAMVFFMFRANRLTRKNIDLLTMLELERMRPQLYFDLFTDNVLLFGKLKNYGATAAFDIEIQLEPKVVKKYGINKQEGLKLTSMKIAYLPPEKELEEFIDSFPQFALDYPGLKFKGRLKYRSVTEKFYDEEISIDLSVQQVPFISKKVIADELETIGNNLEKLVRVVKEHSIRADVTK